MRKGRKRNRRNNPPAEDAEGSADENAIETVPDAGEKRGVEDEDDRMTDQPIEISAELDSLSRDVEQSIAGATPAAKPPSTDSSPVPPPPARNATPEDILGLQTQAFTDLEEKTPAVAPTQPSASRTEASESGGSKPTEAFGVHAAMANEVLRATSDSRGSRKRKRHETEGEDPPADAAEREDAYEDQREDVRFSEDVTISANRRSRRKRFGR